MTRNYRKIFFVNGKKRHWKIGREHSIWGFQLRGLNRLKVESRLQELGFGAGSEILAITGPLAHLRAVVGSSRGVFWDDPRIFWFEHNETYPARFELTNIKDINRPWFLDAQYGRCLTVLQDVYFERKSLYLPNAGFENDPKVDLDVVYGGSTILNQPNRPTPSRVEEDYRNKFARQYRCEDGHEVRSLSEKDIDDWLYRRNITHAYEPVVAIPEGLIPDFKVINSKGKDIYLEFWGMSEDPVYRERMKRKREIYLKYNLPLVEIGSDDLKNLDFILSKRLIEKDVVFIP